MYGSLGIRNQKSTLIELDCFNITLITLDPPELKYDEHFGMYVWVTTLKGFEYLKEKGYDFGIRVRSDFLVDIPQVFETDQR